MILGTIWERYIFRETLKVFFLFLGCFYSLYALIDSSTHMHDFLVNKRIEISHMVTYYTFQFFKRADLLIPLALLISVIKVLLTLNASRELVALQAGGIPLKRIMRPLFLIACGCAAFNLVSAEWIQPTSLNYLDKFREEHFKHSFRGNRKEPIHILYLKDQSKILYQSLDSAKELYFDLFWIRSSDTIWRMKYLSTDLSNPVGTYVDHLERNAQGHFEKTESFESYTFPPFRLEPDLAGKGYVPLENRRASELVKMLLAKKKTTAFEYPQVMTQFLFKCIMPLLSLLVVAAAVPFCVRYARLLPMFFTYALALFGFIAFFALMDAGVILGENNILSPFAAIVAPFALCSLIFGWKYAHTH